MRGKDGALVRSDQATIWRWREAYQNDFAARIEWTLKPRTQTNHPPLAILNGDATEAPIFLNASVGQTITLDASRSVDPDKGQRLSFRWFSYDEAGAGLSPLTSVDIKGAREPRAQIVAKATCRPIVPGVVVPCRSGIAHVILEVRDNGAPALISYRRVIVKVSSAAAQ